MPVHKSFLRYIPGKLRLRLVRCQATGHLRGMALSLAGAFNFILYSLVCLDSTALSTTAVIVLCGLANAAKAWICVICVIYFILRSNNSALNTLISFGPARYVLNLSRHPIENSSQQILPVSICPNLKFKQTLLRHPFDVPIYNASHLFGSTPDSRPSLIPSTNYISP